jgi:DNA-binding NarL/FixJ family response regulator
MLAEAAGLRGDLAAMRSLAARVWDEVPGGDSTIMFLGVVHLSRIESWAAYDDPDRLDRAEAAEHLDRMAQALAAVPRPMLHEEAAALELAAQTDRFHGRDARQALDAALAAWTAIDHVPDAAVTHLALAEAHAQAGDRDTARTHLGEGRRIASDLGARPWLDRAAEIARTYGFSTRERRSADVFTDRELEVLQLLAEGRTNKEIAGTLFISPKTASVHVSRIITKTSAGNRTEAVANARRHGLLTSES